MAASGFPGLVTGFIQNFGGGEIIVVIIVALVVLGPDRLPEMARSAGRMLHKFKTMTAGLQSQVSDVMDDPAMQPIKELGEFAARPRQKLAEYALEAEADERAKQEQASIEATAAEVIAAAEADAAGDDAGVSADPPAPSPLPGGTPIEAQAADDQPETPERESA